MAMTFPEHVHSDIQLRLRRLEGQLRGVQTMIAEGRDCEAIITQLAAAKGALDRINYRLIGAGLRHCLSDEDDTEGMTADELERLFLQLS